jgi:hypothetical protein
MTTLYVDNIAPNLQSKISAPNLQLPSGSVVQVVQGTTVANIATTSTSFTSTGFSLNITPTSTSSKILIMLNGGGVFLDTTSENTMHTTVYRGATNLANSTYGFTRHSTPGGSWQLTPHSFSFLDSPSTTSATTYTIYYRSTNGNQIQFSNNDRGIVALTLMEIAG